MFCLKVLQFIRNISLLKIDGSKKKYPKVIQLPITYRCNSRCLMCNVWKMDTTDEAEILEFSEFMKDELFKKVQSVGINGGEPTLIGNIDEYAKVILTLPVIKSHTDKCIQFWVRSHMILAPSPVISWSCFW